MADRLFLGKINVSKIDKSRLFKGEKGTYMDVAIWINENPDEDWKALSIQQSGKPDQNLEGIYIGNCKEWNLKNKKEETPSDMKL